MSRLLCFAPKAASVILSHVSPVNPHQVSLYFVYFPLPVCFCTSQAECVANGCLWEDPEFPAEDPSLFFENPPSQYPDIEWLRPGVCSVLRHVLTDNSKFKIVK